MASATILPSLRGWVIWGNGFFPFRTVAQQAYRVAFLLAVHILGKHPKILAVLSRRGHSFRPWVPGLSDFDLSVVVEEGTNLETDFLPWFWKRYALVKKIIPMLGEVEVFEEPDFDSYLKNGPAFTGAMKTHSVALARSTTYCRGARLNFFRPLRQGPLKLDIFQDALIRFLRFATPNTIRYTEDRNALHRQLSLHCLASVNRRLDLIQGPQSRLSLEPRFLYQKTLERLSLIATQLFPVYRTFQTFPTSWRPLGADQKCIVFAVRELSPSYLEDHFVEFPHSRHEGEGPQRHLSVLPPYTVLTPEIAAGIRYLFPLEANWNGLDTGNINEPYIKRITEVRFSALLSLSNNWRPFGGPQPTKFLQMAAVQAKSCLEGKPLPPRWPCVDWASAFRELKTQLRLLSLHLNQPLLR